MDFNNYDVKNLRNIIQQGWMEKYPDFANTCQRWFPLDSNYLLDKKHYLKSDFKNIKNIPYIDYKFKDINEKKNIFINKNLELNFYKENGKCHFIGNITCPITLNKTECFVKISVLNYNNDIDYDNDYEYEYYEDENIDIKNENNKEKYICEEWILDILLNYELKNNDFFGHFYLRSNINVYVILITKKNLDTIANIIDNNAKNLKEYIELSPYIKNFKLLEIDLKFLSDNKLQIDKNKPLNMLKLNEYKINDKTNKILLDIKNNYENKGYRSIISLFRGIFAQTIFFALGSIKFKYKFIHNDFKLDNIMVNNTNEKYVYVKIYDNNKNMIQVMQIPTYGLLIDLIDFEWSSCQIKSEDKTYNLYSSSQLLYSKEENNYVDIAQLSIIFLRYFNLNYPIFAEKYWFINSNDDDKQNYDNTFLELKNFLNLLLKFACNDDNLMFNDIKDLKWVNYFYTYINNHCKRENSTKDLYEYFEDYKYDKPLDEEKMLIGNYSKGCFNKK